MFVVRTIILIFTLCLFSFAQRVKIVVVYTHNTNGILENCQCPERSYGALEKRAAVIDSIRKEEQNVLLLDTGDILDIRKDHLLHGYIIRAYNFMNYDYWTPGDQDFIEGEQFFLDKLLKMNGRMLASNIKYKQTKIEPLYAVQNYQNVRLGITGTIRADLQQYLEPVVSANFQFENQINSLQHVIKKLSNISDFLILLSHSGIEQDRTIAKQFSDINIIIGGHSQSILAIPEQVGSTSIFQVGESGYRVGVISLWFEDKMFKMMEHNVILLTSEMKNDPNVLQMIQDYHSERLKN
jgi:2',3'-cyclic-nucleotide 2'-phosphodiesterase (5'-nucleotidase family)